MNISKRTIIPALLLAAGTLYMATRSAPGADDMAIAGERGTRAELHRTVVAAGNGAFRVTEEIDHAKAPVETDPDLANGFDQITGRPYGRQWRQ
jgi:hypothetical protein